MKVVIELLYTYSDDLVRTQEGSILSHEELRKPDQGPNHGQSLTTITISIIIIIMALDGFGIRQRHQPAVSN